MLVARQVAKRLKDTRREKTPSNKTPAISEMDICVVGTYNSLYEVLQLKQKFQKGQVVPGKTPLFVIGQFCTSHSVCVIIWLLTEQFCMEMLRFQS